MSNTELSIRLTRYANGLGDNDRNTRKNALKSINDDIATLSLDSDDNLQTLIESTLFKPLLRAVSDPVEACRERALTIIRELLTCLPQPYALVPLAVPVLVQRMGQPDCLEPSEEMRLLAVGLLTRLIEVSSDRGRLFLDDFIRILQRTLVDPHPEVRKASCTAASLLAKTIPKHFHNQSESLINPLMSSISHQHSKVRVAVINCLHDVIQYGDNKSVDDVTTHLAQRLFDGVPSVRRSVIECVGAWLVNLYDRYSYFRKLIPLLLTGSSDDVMEIGSRADSLWAEVGTVFLTENEEELKDKTDFATPTPKHYPQGAIRPNLGCRTLVYRNLNQILPGNINDLSDWVDATRVKSSQLLYTLLLNSEDVMTQHLERILAGLYRGAADETSQVVRNCVRSAELVGYFVPVELWAKHLAENLRQLQSPAVLRVTAGVLLGAESGAFEPEADRICRLLAEPDIRQSHSAVYQRELLQVVDALVELCTDYLSPLAFYLFNVTMTTYGLTNEEAVVAQCKHTLDGLRVGLGLPDVQSLYDTYTKPLLVELSTNHAEWNQFSMEAPVFDCLLVNCGPVLGTLLDEAIPIILSCLSPSRSVEMRLEFFALLFRLCESAASGADSAGGLGRYALALIREGALPSMAWKPGRTAGALRGTATTCMWVLLKLGLISPGELVSITETLLPQLLAMLDDDNPTTRLMVVRVLNRFLSHCGDTLDVDTLHKVYPDLLKRLDDSSSEVRTHTCKTLYMYFGCFPQPYDSDLYRAHTEVIYKTLLIYLDDKEADTQEAVYNVLLRAQELNPSLLREEINLVRLKHRESSYCNKLLDAINVNKH